MIARRKHNEPAPPPADPMKTGKAQTLVNRRAFIRGQCAILGCAAFGNIATGNLLAAAGRPRTGKTENPFAYSVDRFEQTDPALIGYTEIRRFKSPCAEPRRLAIAADNNIYLAGEKRICVMSPDGSVIREIGLGGPPQCVAVAADKSMYVGFRDHIEVFSANGARKAVLESPKGQPYITGLAVTQNEVFAADSGNRVVLRYQLDGKIASRIGARDKEAGMAGFVLPSPNLDVETRGDDLIYVNNPGRHRVECYSVAGELLKWWGKPSAGIEGFCGCCNPIALALLPDGRFVTCEKGLPRVKVYSAAGQFDCVVAGPESFRENARAGAGSASDPARVGLDAAVDSNGHIYVLDRVTGNIHVMVPKTKSNGAP